MLPFDNKCGVPGDARPPGRHHARDVECRRPGGRGVAADRARGAEHRDLRRHRGAVQLQRAGAALLPAPRRQRGRRAGEPPAQGRALTGRVTPSRSRCGRRSTRSPGATARRPRSRRSRRGRRCSRPSWPRCTRPTTRRAWPRRSGSARSSRRRPAWWTSTGRSRPRSSRARSAWTACRAAEAGASVDQVTQTLYLALSGAPAGLRASPTAREARPSCRGCRSRALVARGAARAADRDGAGPAAARALRHGGRPTREARRIRKDLRPVIYVTGDVAGAIESPVYAILAMNAALDTIRVNGAAIARYNAVRPTASTRPRSSGTASGR